MEQELLTLPEHLSSRPGFTGVRVVRSLVFCVVFCRSLFVLLFFFFFFVIVLSVLFRFTDFDYLFGIFKLFLSESTVYDCVNIHRIVLDQICAFDSNPSSIFYIFAVKMCSR